MGNAQVVRLAVAATVACLALPASAAAAGRTWTGPVASEANDAGSIATGVACPATYQCTAIDALGREITFDPTNPGSPQPVEVYPQGGLETISCPATNQCTAVDSNGGAVTFDPADPSGATVAQIVDTPPPISSLTCPTTTQCTVLADGGEVTFDPQSPAPVQPVDVDGSKQLGALDCLSAHECVGVGSDGSEVTFDPSDTAAASPITIASGDYLNSVVCQSSNRCVIGGSGSDGHGTEVTFDPSDSSAAAPAQVGTFGWLSIVACPTTSLCIGRSSEIAMDIYSARTYEFDPGNPAAASEISGVDGQVACPGTDQCTTINGNDAYRFDPTAPANGSAQQIDQSGDVTALDCPTDGQCTALTNDDTSSFGPVYNPEAGISEVTFDPGSPTLSPVSIEGPPEAFGFTCPVAHQCTMSLGSGVSTFDPTVGPPNPLPGETAMPDDDEVGQIACPAVDECAAIGNQYAVTFDPNGSSGPSEISFGSVLSSDENVEAIACPWVAQCTVVSSDGRELTFDPQTGGDIRTETVSDDSLSRVACPSVSQCTAVDGANAVTFDPSRQRVTVSAALDPGNTINGLACPSIDDCVVIDSGGQALEGDPWNLGSWVTTPVTTLAPLTQLACSSPSQCVAVDAAGDFFVGADPSQASGRPPGVTNGAPAHVGSDAAGLTGVVNPNGTLATDCELEWGTDTSYGKAPVTCDRSPGGGSSSVDVTAGLSGLTPGKTYHYRFVAESSDGRAYGSDATFTTSASPGSTHGSSPGPTSLRIAAPARATARAWRLTVRAGARIRLRVTLLGGSGRPLARRLVQIVQGRRRLAEWTGREGSLTFVVAHARAQTIEFRFAGGSGLRPTTASVRIQIARDKRRKPRR